MAKVTYIVKPKKGLEFKCYNIMHQTFLEAVMSKAINRSKTFLSRAPFCSAAMLDEGFDTDN